MNILIYAGEASTAPSKINIALRRERDTNKQILLQVNDEGVGISKVMLESIFQPFVSTKPAGHGLGLASTKRVIESHGGTHRRSHCSRRRHCYS